MATIKIKQVRSRIRCPKDQKRCRTRSNATDFGNGKQSETFG